MQRSTSDGHRWAVKASFSGHQDQQGAQCRISVPWKAHLSNLNDFLPCCCEATNTFSIGFAPNEIMTSVMLSSGPWRWAWREGIPKATGRLPTASAGGHGVPVGQGRWRGSVPPQRGQCLPLANSGQRHGFGPGTSCLI